MNISQQFAPPFKLIAPFFIIGVIIYLCSILSLYMIDINNLYSLNPSVLSWVHLFLLGFVMMIIFGAMAQLVPVVLEIEHFAVELYYAIYPLLLIGTLLMAVGFYSYPILLSFGGVITFIAFMIFLFETFLTIKKVKKFNFVISTVLIANIFLFSGIVVGIIMALGYSGLISVNLDNLLKSHLNLVLVGYVGITIMGMSLVLLPMFWLSHSFSWKYVKAALILLSVSVVFVLIGSFSNIEFFYFFSYGLTLLSFILYFYQIYIIYKTRVRLDVDIYFKSMVFSYVSLLVSIILSIIYFITQSQVILLGTFWIIFLGFITHVIIGHLYKIIPFLVWYEKFSPYVGKKKVPMLSDMVPVKSANMQYIFTSVGVVGVLIGIVSGYEIIYKSGVSFLTMGAIFLTKDIFYMINFKGE